MLQHFHQERVVQHLLRGLWCVLQRDIKVSCDLSVSIHPSNKHTTGTAVGLHSAIVSQLCFLLIYWLWTRRGWGHVSAFLCGVVIRNSAAHSSALILLTVTWHPICLNCDVMCGSVAISSFGNRVHDRWVKSVCFWSNNKHTTTGQDWLCLLVAVNTVSRSSPQHVCAITVSIPDNTVKWLYSVPISLTTVKTVVGGSCGSRGWAGCLLIRQFNLWLLLSTGHDGQVSNLHGCSATIRVCVNRLRSVFSLCTLKDELIVSGCVDCSAGIGSDNTSNTPSSKWQKQLESVILRSSGLCWGPPVHLN